MTDFPEQLRAAVSASYDIERELAGGGMSRVFVATERALGRRVVIKVLSPDLIAGVNTERFRREVQVAARLSHPHIVPLLSAGEHGDLLYFTMPYIEGESLRVVLARDGRLSVTRVVRILHDVVDALAYAHGQGIVHRDIKPANILTQGSHALVADFGVAKAISAALPSTGVTTAGMVVGTPSYMAPEQLAGDPAADHRMDIYAVGLLAYELLRGSSPFAGLSPQETLAAQLTRMPEPIESFRSDVPPNIARVIMRCLAKSPDERPATARALKIELDQMSTPEGAVIPAVHLPPRAVDAATVPLAATPRTELPAARKPARWSVGLTVAALVLMGGMAWVWAVRHHVIGPSGPPAVAETAASPTAVVAEAPASDEKLSLEDSLQIFSAVLAQLEKLQETGRPVPRESLAASTARVLSRPESTAFYRNLSRQSAAERAVPAGATSLSTSAGAAAASTGSATASATTGNGGSQTAGGRPPGPIPGSPADSTLRALSRSALEGRHRVVVLAGIVAPPARAGQSTRPDIAQFATALTDSLRQRLGDTTYVLLTEEQVQRVTESGARGLNILLDAATAISGVIMPRRDSVAVQLHIARRRAPFAGRDSATAQEPQLLRDVTVSEALAPGAGRNMAGPAAASTISGLVTAIVRELDALPWPQPSAGRGGTGQGRGGAGTGRAGGRPPSRGGRTP